MDIWIYDFEVFKHDWLVVFKSVETSETVVVHNNNHQLREFINRDVVLGGFNNKHYDDHILKAIIHGADNIIVKNLNDFIIKEKKQAWDFPFLQYKRKTFNSFDLKDDLPEISLKAIEGNMGLNIVESGVSFDIDRPLTKAEIKETIYYCECDVDATIELFKKRQSYINAKRTIAKIKGMDEVEAICLTNAKLTAQFLDAKAKKYNDEFEYEVPSELKIGRYKHVVDFFLNPVQYTINQLELELSVETIERKKRSLRRKIEKIKKSDRYDCSLETNIAGVKHICAWGGIHGAKPKIRIYEEDGYIIVTIDVGSYYPSMMIQYNYASRSIPNDDGYVQVYDKRMGAKHDGDKETAGALKLPLNTAYGAMKNKYNALYDPKNASAICITGQLFLIDLIDKLEDVPEFQLIQSNTDGIVIRYPVKVDEQVVSIVTEWEQRTRMGMEYTVIQAIAQKDVNNYVIKTGETYLYKDGERVVTEEDRGSLKMKGGYVSLAKGGSFINNSLVIVHKALVDFFMNGVPVETTINACTNLLDFQMIAKFGTKYERAYHEINGEWVEVQKVNRVYATTNAKYGTIKKMKAGKLEKIQNLPERCLIDNENRLTINDIDKNFYIELANKRIVEYTGNITNKPKEVRKMAVNVKPQAETQLNIYEKINALRSEWLQANVQKTGINRFAEYKYFELSDIVPVVQPIMQRLGLCGLFDFDNEYAYLYIVDINSNIVNMPDIQPTQLVFKSPMRNLVVKGMNEIQALGGVETYQRRYLYMMLLDIVEQDSFDAGTVAEETAKPTPAPAPRKANRPATPEKRAAAKKELIDEDGSATDIQIKAIKGGLKKLRDKDDSYEAYISQVVKKVKAGIDRKQAEDLMIEIAAKVEE